MSDKSYWNDRYSNEEYLYGIEPNTFLVDNAHFLSGPVLSLSEGEGRNAVFLAKRKLEVHGVDISETALLKAKALAIKCGVSVSTEIVDLAEFVPKENYYASVISIFAHLPSAIRTRLYPLIEKSLKPNGIILLEAYSEKQLSRFTGGPKDIDMLMTKHKLSTEFSKFEPIIFREIERVFNEGQGHSGVGSVVQYIGRKCA